MRASRLFVLLGLALLTLLSAGAATPPSARLSVADVRVVEGDGGTRKATFVIRRTGSTGRVASVGYQVRAGTAAAPADFVRTSGRATFRRGQTRKTVSVTVRADVLDERDETFTLRLSSPRGARIVRAIARATIVDDDAASPGNAPPVADAGPDQDVDVVDTVTLDGRGSSDPEGAGLTYAWTFSSKPPGSGATLTGAASARPTFLPDEPGVYTVKLTVGDGVSSATDTVSVAATSQVVRFAALGDTGKGNAGQRFVAVALRDTCAARGCDFVTGLGDNIYESGVSSTSDPQLETKFRTPYADVPLDFWMLLGNHDYGGNGAGTESAKGDIQVAYSTAPENTGGKWKMPAKTYRRTAEHVLFVTLDTTPAMFAPQPAQREQVSGWLTGSNAYWKIALGHHPYRSNGPHGNAGTYEGLPFSTGAGAEVKALIEQGVCTKAHVYLAGHDHNQQWLQQHQECPGTELIVSGAGATVTPKNPRTQMHNPVWFENYTQLGFVYVVIRDRRLTAEFVGVDPATGSSATLFTRTIER